MQKPKLIKIDLKKGVGHNHPDIKVGGDYQYLAKIGGRWGAGSFSRQWFGLSFSGMGWTTHQFDTPGTNHSDWEELYLIQTRQRTVKTKVA